MADIASVELKLDTTAAQAFLDACVAATRNRFAIAKPGDVVFLECERPMTVDQFTQLKSTLGAAAANAGVKLVVLPAGVKVAQAPPPADPVTALDVSKCP